MELRVSYMIRLIMNDVVISQYDVYPSDEELLRLVGRYGEVYVQKKYWRI